MNKFAAHSLIALALLILPMTSCNSTPATQNSLFSAQQTATPSDFGTSTEALTDTAIPVSTITPIDTAISTSTETPTGVPQATQPGCHFTNNIAVPLSAGDAFCVYPDRNPTITSTDRKGHTCIFKGKKDVRVSFGYSMGLPKLVGSGDYTLTCDRVPISVKISLIR